MVSALAKLLRDKSTDGGLSSHDGTVELDEVKMSFCLKPIADKSDADFLSRLSRELIHTN